MVPDEVTSLNPRTKMLGRESDLPSEGTHLCVFTHMRITNGPGTGLLAS